MAGNLMRVLSKTNGHFSKLQHVDVCDCHKSHLCHLLPPCDNDMQFPYIMSCAYKIGSEGNGQVLCFC